MPITYTTPQVQHARQSDTDLCWAACVKMTMVVVKNNPTLTQDWTDARISTRMFQQYLNEPQMPYMIKAAMENYGAKNVVFESNRFPDLADIQTMIAGNRPIIVGIFWQGGGGHAMVISGFGTDASGATAVTLNDPYEANEQTISLQQLSAGIYQGASHRWGGWLNFT